MGVTAAARATSDTYLVGAPTDPQLRRIGENILAEVHAAALKALAHAEDSKRFPLAGDPLERLFARRLSQKPAAQVRRAATRARTNDGKPEVLSTLDLTSPVAVSTQLAKALPSVKLTKPGLMSAVEKPGIAADSDWMGLDEERGDPDIESVKPFLTRGVLKAVKEENGGGIVLKPPATKPKPKLKFVPYDGVRLRLIKMVCVEETTGGGDDEIALAGIATAANGKTHKLSPFMVSDSFDSGESVQFGLSFNLNTGKVTDSGPREFFSFGYGTDNTVKHPQLGTLKLDWPRVYHATFLLAEIDNGGFPGFVTDLFNLVKEKAAAAVGAAVGAMIGGVVGSTIPGLGTAIGAAVGAIVGWVLGELWSLFMVWWEDDEFVPITVAVKRNNQFSRFINESSFDSSNKVVWWKGHGGHYKLKFDWQMVGGLAA